MSATAVSEDRGRTTATSTSSCTASTSDEGEHGFATHDVDFFLGAQLSWSPCTTATRGRSRSCATTVARNHKLMGEGPVALFHRIVDAMVDHYRPEVEKLEDRLDEIEEGVFDAPDVRRSSATSSTRSATSRRCAASSRRSATSSAGWRAASSSTSAPRCRSASATSTTTWFGSPTKRSSSRTASRAFSTRTCRTSAIA